MNLPLTSKTNCQKQNSKLEVVQYFFYFSKMAKTGFDLKNVFSSFSLFLALKKGTNFVSGETFKIVKYISFVLILGLFQEFQGFSETLFCHVPGEKATDQSKILDLRSQNSLLQHDMCPKFFFKKSLHPMYRCTVPPREKDQSGASAVQRQPRLKEKNYRKELIPSLFVKQKETKLE